jgi:hypothetical protein
MFYSFSAVGHYALLASGGPRSLCWLCRLCEWWWWWPLTPPARALPAAQAATHVVDVPSQTAKLGEMQHATAAQNAAAVPLSDVLLGRHPGRRCDINEFMSIGD